jgi:hypothetical protein
MPDYGKRKNSEGYSDPTPFEAMKALDKEEAERQRRLSTLIYILKANINAAGFELITRIELRDKKTGREYK